MTEVAEETEETEETDVGQSNCYDLLLVYDSVGEFFSTMKYWGKSGPVLSSAKYEMFQCNSEQECLF